MKERFNFLWGSDIFSHLTSMKYIPRWVVLCFDIFLCLISYYASYYISIKLYSNDVDLRVFSFYQRMGVIAVLQVFFFWLFHTYSGVLRYSGYVDAIKLLLAVSFNVIVLSTANFVVFATTAQYMFYYFGLLIYAILSFLLLFILRLFVKTVYDYTSQN
jgi:FlaA1/EpsC-like NDP-sugar epimerase